VKVMVSEPRTCGTWECSRAGTRRDARVRRSLGGPLSERIGIGADAIDLGAATLVVDEVLTTGSRPSVVAKLRS
jgi:hypothetical protein